MKAASAALACILLALATPAASQTAEEDYQAGVAARLAGHFEEALKRLSRAADAEPANADIALQIGFAHLALNHLDEAEAAFRRTLSLAPDYADAKLGLAQVAQRRGDRKAALAELGAIGPGNVDADRLRRQIEATGGDWRWRIDADGSYSQLHDLPDWQSAALLVQHRPDERLTVAATVETTRRFHRTDVYGEARVDYRFAPGNNAYVLVGGTPDADHRPNWQLGTGASVRVRGGPYATVLRLDLRAADYPTGGVQTVTPGIEQYVGGNAWITAQWINIWDRHTGSSGWLLRGDVIPVERLRVFAGAANAPDLDEGVVIETFSLFGGVSFDLDDHLTARISLAHDDPKGSAERKTVAVGLGYRF